jgi:hypothetical protein
MSGTGGVMPHWLNASLSTPLAGCVLFVAAAPAAILLAACKLNAAYVILEGFYG